MANPATIPATVLIEAEEVMRQIKELKVAEPIPSALWMKLSNVSARLTFYKENVLALQRLPVARS